MESTPRWLSLLLSDADDEETTIRVDPFEMNDEPIALVAEDHSSDVVVIEHREMNNTPIAEMPSKPVHPAPPRQPTYDDYYDDDLGDYHHYHHSTSLHTAAHELRLDPSILGSKVTFTQRWLFWTSDVSGTIRGHYIDRHGEPVFLVQSSSGKLHVVSTHQLKLVD